MLISFCYKIEKEANHTTTMEDCIETTTVDGHKTITVFTKDGVAVGGRVVYTYVSLEIEQWYDVKGWQYRKGDKPAVIYYEDGKVTQEEWYKDGKRHRKGDKPAVIYYEDGKVTQEEWYKDGKRHRKGDKPPVIYYEDGKIVKQHWYKKGKLHRDGQPAIIHHKDDKIISQLWYKDDKWYREIGPNYITKDNGVISNHWLDTRGKSIVYIDVPEERRLSPEFRQAIRCLPLPIGQAIAYHFMEIWQFVEAD